MKKTFVKQTEVNSAGGVRISVYKQEYLDDELIGEGCHRITIDIDDDFDAIIAMNNAHLEQMGYPAIDPVELDLPRGLRATAHAHPAVNERMGIEREQRAEQRRKDQEERERQAEEAAKAEIEAEKRKAAEAKAFDDAVDAAVAKALRKA